jgi:hypothetical protein
MQVKTIPETYNASVVSEGVSYVIENLKFPLRHDTISITFWIRGFEVT